MFSFLRVVACALIISLASVAIAAAQENDAIPGDQVEAELPPPDQPQQETILITDRPGPPIEVSWETELVGGDYDSGETNSMLSEIGNRECRVICMLDDRCKAYTHDGVTRMCTLKNSAGERRYLSNAISGVFVDRQVVDRSRVVYRGFALTEYDESLVWRPSDTAEAYIDRVRGAATARGATCQQEIEDIKTLNVRTSVAATGTVGQGVAVSWAGNGLQSLTPAWLVLSTPSTVRFSGKGFFGLNTGAYGPFGSELARSQTRALAALYSHSAGESGGFDVVPLAAGELQLNARFVAYLRACREEVVLSEQAFTIPVQPAAPRIVVHDPYALNVYGQQAEIASLGRKVLYNDSRFLIVETELGSEILERNGTDIRFSPTGRFVAIRSDNATEIVDVIDGAVVARIGDNMSNQDGLLWLHHDSFVAVTRPPWGRAWLASTLNITKPLYAWRAGPACCDLTPTDGLIDVNLENDVVRIKGGLGGFVANLQDFEIAVDYPDPAESGFGTEEDPAATLLIDAMGPISALPGGVGFNQPLPAQPGAVVLSKAEIDIAGDPEEKPGGTQLLETRGAVALIRPQDYLEQRVAGIDLAPFGFEPAPELRAEVLLSPRELAAFSAEQYDEADKIRAITRYEVAVALAAKGIRIDWMKPSGDFDADINCDYIRLDGAGPSELPGALTLVQRIDRAAGAIWIMRSQCQGGATSATQVFKSALMVIDEASMAGRPASEAIVEQFSTQNTQFDQAFYDADFETKLIGQDKILFYMPAGGAIGVFDLKSRTFSYQQQNLQRGDLLSDAHLGADATIALQVNADQSFSLHRLADSKKLLEGRQVDGETVFWAPDFRFDSTAEGASFVELRFPGLAGQYTFQQFDSRLRRGGLLDAALGDRLGPSDVDIRVPPRLAGELSGDGGRITGTATPTSSSALKEIRLYQDGVLTGTFAIAASGQPVAIAAERLPGTRWVSLVAADSEGLVSLPIGRDLGADNALTRVHLLAIGINAYEDAALPRLSLARSDAEHLETALKALDGKSIALDAASTTVLTDAGASREAILDAARQIVARSGPGDNAVIAFAGHGLQGADGRFYLGLSTTNVADVERTALAWDELATILSAAKGRVTVLLDACHSGSAGLLASNDEAVATIRSAIPSGLTVLAASKDRELSAEMQELGGGVFTYALVQAILDDRAAADLNGNGRIEVSELYRSVKDRVSTLRLGEQTPWLSRNQMIGDFALF